MQRCNILALKTKQNSKRRTDLCNYRLALQIARTRSGAWLGRERRPRLRWGDAYDKDRLETIRPGTGCVPETGGQGSGERDTPAKLPLVL